MCRNHENTLTTIMAHGLHAMIKSEIGCGGASAAMVKPRMTNGGAGAGKMGSRRIFTPQFKLQVLDSYRNDNDCKGNQRATARKYGIHRRQIQKWLQVENNLRSAAANSASGSATGASAMKINLLSATNSSANHHHHHQQQHQSPFQLHPPHHHHHSSGSIHHQNLNSIELKVPLDSARHRVAGANSSNIIISSNGKESNGSGACIISPVPTHTMARSPLFSHPHETPSSSASLSAVLKTHGGRESNAAAVSSSIVAPRPSFSPVAGSPDFPDGYDRLHLLDPYYPHHYLPYHAKFAVDCPIDLSLPQPYRHSNKVMDQQALSPCSTTSSAYSSRPRSSTPTSSLTGAEIKCEPVTPREENSGEAVDLSCRKRKSNSPDGASPPKSVKLFKPYLLDEDDSAEDKDADKDSSIESPGIAESPRDPDQPGRPDYPIIWNFHAHQQQQQRSYYENLYEYGYPLTAQGPPWIPPQASPVSGYDSSTSISSVHSNGGGGDGDLRQQAIESFYHDVSCRGDFHAVASKYNIQRKFVERWLAQDEVAGVTPPTLVGGGAQPLVVG
ncbi:uncharacterized protein LOC129747134 [Uranotaenia lowii]|uniref:uncharacterized protein LOC129747134 n=1 Tax=Uranotaenia lowii TaxID=190385 RepID=UPI00247B1ED3|nr:uncharacterized protein LOC129747134 [Uranotaenia lowii]